jgi:hypothetical protein
MTISRIHLRNIDLRRGKLFGVPVIAPCRAGAER